ncbi:TRAP transporter large permease [Hyphomicrobium sp. CS1BSMeth3]|uniref:TRAP transporter large permease n=1 Tax=Hyphomicrobium sp. CS1BSMeth3 TaxID=1892844 RepID=UPI000B02BA99|nr:TRAP transporter large permease [Hyphomicrobium sp. CS1BSMeth3]
MDFSILLMFAVFGALIAIEVPIAFALAGSALLYLILNPVVPLTIVVQRMAPGIDSFPLLAVPLFILAGQLLNTSGIAARIFHFAHALVGHIRGGLAHCNIVASMIFSSMSGVAQADAAGLGLIEVKAMRERGFDPAFAAAVSAASATIGPIIPPSVIMVIYGLMAQVSVADLFLAGILPGILMGVAMMGMVYFLAVTGRVHCPVERRATLAELSQSFLAGLPAFLAPIVLVGGLMLGIATPTELGALTVVYAIALGFWYRELTWKMVFDAINETLIFCGVLVFIIAAAVPFGWLISFTRLPAELSAVVLQFTQDPVVVLAIINVLLLFLGCFMETTAILLIVTPTLLPIILAVGIDPVHFGIIISLNLIVGAITPPFGVILFILKDIAKITFAQMVRAVLPFYIPLGIALLIITYWPGFVLFVPSLFKG